MAPIVVTTSVQLLESVVLKLTTQRGRVNVAALYRPPSSLPYGVTIGQFCIGFTDYVDELLTYYQATYCYMWRPELCW